VGDLTPLLADATRTRQIAEAERTIRFDLSSPRPVSEALATLASAPVASEAEPAAEIGAPAAEVEFRFANRSGAIFATRPFAPRSLTARWRDAAGTVVATSRADGLLPIALAPGDTATSTFTLDVPAATPAAPTRSSSCPRGSPISSSHGAP